MGPLHIESPERRCAAFVGAISLLAVLAWETQAAGDRYYVFLTLVVRYVVLVSAIRNRYDLLLSSEPISALWNCIWARRLGVLCQLGGTYIRKV